MDGPTPVVTRKNCYRAESALNRAPTIIIVVMVGAGETQYGTSGSPPESRSKLNPKQACLEK